MIRVAKNDQSIKSLRAKQADQAWLRSDFILFERVNYNDALRNGTIGLYDTAVNDWTLSLPEKVYWQS